MNMIPLPNIEIEQDYHTLEERKLFLNEEAERMRENPTEGELLFKQFCDKYEIPYKHQVPVFVGYRGFILDFELFSKGNPKLHNSKKRKIVVEIDGEYHNTKEQKEKDAARTKTLKGAAFSVIRFTNEEVKDEKIIIQKFLSFLPKIKETTLLQKFSELNENTILNEKVEDKEVMYWKEKYKNLKTAYEELEEWAIQVQKIAGNINNSCPLFKKQIMKK